MADCAHNKNCSLVAEEKAAFFKDNKIPGNLDDFLLLYVSVGSDTQTLIISKAANIDMVKNAILAALFCPCCTVDIELNPVEELYDGIHINVIRGKDAEGNWGNEIFVES